MNDNKNQLITQYHKGYLNNELNYTTPYYVLGF